MSHFILVCERDPKPGTERSDQLRACSDLLQPQGVEPRAPTLIVEQGLALALVDTSGGAPVHASSVCVGCILDAPGEWWRPGATAPDGTYALCRCSTDEVEIVTDVIASRTVWYYHDADVFLASTSQRPLIALLRSFKLEPQVVTWLVASRSLGPCASYDKRLLRAPADGTVLLDRRAWSIDVRSHWEPPQADPVGVDEHVRRLNEALVETCGYLAADSEDWQVSLSGGYDSRAILVGMVQAGAAPSCVTWGLSTAIRDERSDAFVARALARSLDVPFEYFPLDDASCAATDALEEFIALSEGQVVDLTMYADGFAVWRSLVARGCHGIVRGHGYQWSYLDEFQNDCNVRWHNGVTLMSEYAPIHPIHRLGLPEQVWPERFERQRGESLLEYRDRLQHYVYNPARIAPLNQTKTSHVEIANPLQARRVSRVVARLPEPLRLHPGALVQLLERHGPKVPFASRPAATPPDILCRPEMRSAIAEALCTDTAVRLFDADALGDTVQAILCPPRQPGRAVVGKALRSVLPRKALNYANPVVGARLDRLQMALRMVIAARAVELFEDDARLLDALKSTDRLAPHAAAGAGRASVAAASAGIRGTHEPASTPRWPATPAAPGGGPPCGRA